MKRLLCGVLVTLALAAGLAKGETYPTKPIRLVVPYAAGGTADAMARAIQQQLQHALGQAVLVDNRSGAGGAIAAREVSKAPPDGYTLLFANASIVAVTPRVVKAAGFDGVKDFAPVALVSSAHLFVVVGADVPVSDLKGFISYARSQSKPLAYASAGVGSFGHLSTELFAKQAGLKLTHVPYRGQAQTTNAVVAGEVPLLITTASGAMSGFIAQGRLKLLAVTSSTPSPLAPQAPTVSSVLPGYVAESWFAILAPVGTPLPIVRRLNEAIGTILATREMHEQFRDLGMEIKTGTPELLGEMMVQEVVRWGPVIRESNIKAE